MKHRSYSLQYNILCHIYFVFRSFSCAAIYAIGNKNLIYDIILMLPHILRSKEKPRKTQRNVQAFDLCLFRKFSEYKLFNQHTKCACIHHMILDECWNVSFFIISINSTVNSQNLQQTSHKIKWFTREFVRVWDFVSMDRVADNRDQCDTIDFDCNTSIFTWIDCKRSNVEVNAVFLVTILSLCLECVVGCVFSSSFLCFALSLLSCFLFVELRIT